MLLLRAAYATFIRATPFADFRLTLLDIAEGAALMPLSLFGLLFIITPDCRAITLTPAAYAY